MFVVNLLTLVFTPDFVLSAFHLLIDKLLPLTSTDLERLEDEPEEWLIAEDNDEEAWKFEFRVSWPKRWLRRIAPSRLQLTVTAVRGTSPHGAQQCLSSFPQRTQGH